jgi:hypothetical protein
VDNLLQSPQLKIQPILNPEEKHINGLCDYPKEVCFLSWKRIAVPGLQG